MGTAGVRARLEGLADEKYRAFQSALVPTVDPGRVLGVRMPRLRRLARDLARDEPSLVAAFLADLPHSTYDEDMLHGVLLCRERDYAACVAALDAFLPHVDNWAVCDVLSPAAFKRRPAELPRQAARWMTDAHPYTARFGVSVFMKYYLDEGFDPAYLRAVAKLRSDEYYVRMMVAWYVATALSKRWDDAVGVLERRELDPWTHNKAIQKGVESLRITPEQKACLRALRVRG